MAEDKLKIGYKLKKTRRGKKIHISRAAKDLCIPKKYLTALEKNDTKALPEPIYAVGFVRNYADYLGLDPDPLVETLKATYTDGPEPGGNPAPGAAKNPPSSTNATVLGVMVFLGLAASLGYFGFSTMAEPSYKVDNSGEIPEHIARLLEEDEKETGR